MKKIRGIESICNEVEATGNDIVALKIETVRLMIVALRAAWNRHQDWTRETYIAVERALAALDEP